MTRKKNKLMTFLWSLLPGAGEMYLGFMKQGVSLMAGFWVLCALAGFFKMEILLFLAPVIWFYSFFNTNNLNSLPDDEFYALEDDYLFHAQHLIKNKALIRKYRKLIALVLIVFGCSALWNMVSTMFFSYLLPNLYISTEIYDLLYYLGRSIPQSVVAIGIIIAGFYLIKNKADELNQNNYIPGPPYLKDGEEKKF